MIKIKAEPPKGRRKKRAPPPVEQAESLKSFFDRANNVLDELDTQKEDLSQVYKDAKASGYDPKILRKIVTEKRRDQTDLAEEQALIEAYRHALSEPVKKAIAMVAAGSTLDEASKATGAPRSTVARLTPRAPVPKTRDLETAATSDEHSTTAAGEKGGIGNPDDDPWEARHNEERDEYLGINESCGGVEGHAPSGQDGEAPTVDAGPISEAGPMAKATADSASAAGIKPGPQDTDWDSIVASQPEALRRLSSPRGEG